MRILTFEELQKIKEDLPDADSYVKRGERYLYCSIEDKHTHPNIKLPLEQQEPLVIRITARQYIEDNGRVCYKWHYSGEINMGGG